MRCIVKRFKIVSIVRMAAFLGFITGVIQGVLNILFWGIAMPFTTVYKDDPNLYGNLIANGLFISPIFAALYMAILAAIVFGLYNFFSKRIGGLEINLNRSLLAK